MRLLKVPQQGGRGVRRGLGGNRRSAAFLQLYERGKLDLDAPVQKYCPAFPQRDSLTTSRQLLAHLGGIRHYNKDGKGDVPDDSARHFATMEESLQLFASVRKYRYNNYCLLALSW